MKKVITLVSVLSLSAVLVACGGDTSIKSDEQAEAKTGDNAAPASTEEADDDESEPEEEEEVEEIDAEKEADIWTYYEDATWEEDYNGLKTEIQKVVVSDKAPTWEDESAEESAVGVKFKIENTTDMTFTTYPDQATLVTSTGEQVDADMFVSDSLGGEIYNGVIKEGDVIFYLERGEAESIEWVKLLWTAHEEDDWSNTKEYEAELTLK